MWRFIIFFNAISVIYFANSYIVVPGPEYEPTQGEIWPKPAKESKSETYYNFLRSSFKFSAHQYKCDILKTALIRYLNVIKDYERLARKGEMRNNITDDPNYNGSLQELRVYLTKPCERYPYLEMDESYELKVSTVSTLTSASIWGILRGLESFVQLFYIVNDCQYPLINATKITDYPYYSHRGLLIDTGRHYIKVPVIIKLLDAMEINKMNVLHWHIVDDQSFPYQSDRFPELSERAAFHPSLIYTKKDIEYIVNYAANRGIRVLPEFDVPGHTSSWGAAFPDILTRCFNGHKFIGLGPMDPTKNLTYSIISELFKEVRQRFPEQYLHVGGDEVTLSCWTSNINILKFMRAHDIANPEELHAYFMTLVMPLLGENTTAIVWQEVFGEHVRLPNNSVVQVWKDNSISGIVKAGYQAVYSTAWYLDTLRQGGDWQRFYLVDPRKLAYNDVDLSRIIGGEACMWGEVVDDHNIMTRVWPRASAVAERLWSPSNTVLNTVDIVPDEVNHRLEEHVCRMNRRGIEAEPANGPGFCVTL